MSERPKKLLSQNSELRKDGIFNWTLPAFVVRLSDGKPFNVCPAAGACAKFCYARNGTYNFRNVSAKHLANLEFVLQDPEGWHDAMLAELSRPRMAWKFVRIHDSGDFFSDDYLRLWLRIAREVPQVTFYCYTKEVSRFRRVLESDPAPDNFRYLFSMGGKEDHLIDPERDRHADVFPDEAAVELAGYVSQAASDLLAITLPTTKVGIPANNIRHFNRKIAGRTFAELQRERDDKLAAKNGMGELGA